MIVVVHLDQKNKSILSQSRRLPPLQVVSNSKFVSVGVRSPTEINAREDAQ